MAKIITQVALLAAIGLTFYANLKTDSEPNKALPVAVEDSFEWPTPVEPEEPKPVSVLDHLLIEEKQND